MLRRLIALLVCLTISLQGWAVTGGAAAPCPMQQATEMAASQGTSGDVDQSRMGDCCNDELTFAQTGEPCKSAEPCHAPLLWVPARSEAAPQPAPASGAVAYLPPSAPDDPAASVWRPPSHC